MTTLTAAPSAPTVTVVIPHYFAARRPHLQTIVDAFGRGSHVPQAIWIWNNEPAVFRPPEPLHYAGEIYLQGPQRDGDHRGINLGPSARFITAAAARTDFVLFVDNDTVPDRDTVANLVTRHRLLDCGVLAIATLEGRRIKGGPYKHWPKVYGHGLKQGDRCDVDISLGRGELVPTGLLPRLLQHFPFASAPLADIMDDLWFSACCAKEQIPLVVVPAEKHVSSLGDLPRFGTGASATPDYYARRDATVAEIRRTLHVWPEADHAA